MRSRFTQLLMLLLVAFVAVPSTLPSAAAPGNQATALTSADAAARYTPTSYECSMLSKINAYRKSNGLKSLKMSRTLGAAAKHHSTEMARNDYASHTLLNGVTWSQNITNYGYPKNTYRAENIAAGQSRAAETFAQWKSSPSHNATMLNSAYTAIGIGRAVSDSSTYRWYWTSTFGGTVDSTVSC